MCVLSSNDTFANVLQDFRLNNYTFSAFVRYFDVMVIVMVVIAILTVQVVVM